MFWIQQGISRTENSRKSALQILTIALAVATSGVAATPPPPSGLVVNGSFELGIDPDVQIDAPNSTAITGWTVQSGNIDYVGAGWMAGDGNRSLDMSGTTVGTIRQVIAGLTAGQAYRLSFLMAGNPGLIPPFPSVKRLRASIGSASQEYSFNASGRSANNMGWTEKVLDFTADGSSMTLLFTSLTEGLGGAALDKVTISLETSAPPVNHPPVAVVSSDQLIDLTSEYDNSVLLSCNWWSACLVADGWTWSDPEGGELTYVWSLENDPHALRRRAGGNELPGSGSTHNPPDGDRPGGIAGHRQQDH